MKNFLSILPISIAVLLITVFSIVPHHHHQEVLCVVMEMCEKDNTYNDQHTEHDTSQEETNHESGCTVNSLYTASTHILKSDSSLSDGNNQLSLAQCFCLLASYLLYTPELSVNKTAYPRCVVSYQSASLGLSSGLRAPPVCLS